MTKGKFKVMLTKSNVSVEEFNTFEEADNYIHAMELENMCYIQYLPAPVFDPKNPRDKREAIIASSIHDLAFRIANHIEDYEMRCDHAHTNAVKQWYINEISVIINKLMMYEDL